MKILTVTDAARNFSDLVSRVHYQGEGALLVKGGRPMVKLLPARRPATGRDLAASWAGIRHLSSDDASALSRDIAAARRKLPKLVSKWD